MATASVSGQDDSFSCRICLEAFTKPKLQDPKLLPCTHTFCCKCLQQYMDNCGNGATFECPICRAEIDIPASAENFPTNRYLMAGRSSLPGEFCDHCVKQHAKSKAPCGHNIAPISTDVVEKLFVSVIHTPQIDGKVEVVSSFTTGNTYRDVCDIVPCDGDKCWLLQGGKSKLCMMDVERHELKMVDIKMTVCAMAADPLGGLYVSCYMDNCIKYVSPQLEVSTVTTTVQGPQGLVYSADHGGVIVGNGQLLVVTLDGTVQPYARTQGMSFVNPGNIAFNVNGDLCVSDYEQGCVVIVDTDGNERVRYTGQPLSEFGPHGVCCTWDSKFRPHGVCCDSQGHVIVANDDTNEIHVLNVRGEFVCILDHPSTVLKKVRSVAVDQSGRLWVGEHSGRVKLLKYT